MPRYAGLQRLLHWVIALMVLAQLAGGLSIGLLGFDGVTEMLGKAGRDLLYEYHKTFGILILGLMVIRLFARFEYGRPAYVYEMQLWARIMSALVHYLIYLCLFAMPILGWLATDASNYPVEFFSWNLPQFIAKGEAMGKALYEAHAWVGWGIVILICLHIGGAMKHWFIDRDGVIGRMRPY